MVMRLVHRYHMQSLRCAAGGYHSGYGMQNGAVHLGSGQPTADQGFAGLSNAQLQQRLALLQQSGGLGMGAPPLQVGLACCTSVNPLAQAVLGDLQTRMSEGDRPL